MPYLIHTGVIPAQARIYKTVVLLQLLMLDPRLRGDDTGEEENKVFSCHTTYQSKGRKTGLLRFARNDATAPSLCEAEGDKAIQTLSSL